MIFLNNVSAQYKQYSIYNLNSENNALFIHIVQQINSSVSGAEGGDHIVSGIFCLFIHPQTPLHD